MATAFDLPARRLRLEPVLAVAIGIGLVVAAAGWGVLQVIPEHTGAHRVRWAGAADCGDERVPAVVIGARVYLPCPGGIGRIDPVRGTGEELWPFPEGPNEILLMAPDAAGRLVVVVRVHGMILGGVAGEHGWDTGPAPLGLEGVSMWVAHRAGRLHKPPRPGWEARVVRKGPAPWRLQVGRPEASWWHTVGWVRATGEIVQVPVGDDTHLVFDDGEHVAISAAGDRIDPLSLAAHLRRQVWRARLVQGGLPLALLLALAIARVRGRAPAKALLIAAASYAVAASLCLLRLVSLL